MLSAKCPSCGGTIVFEESNIPTFCSYCGSHLPDMTEFVKRSVDFKIEKQMHDLEMEAMEKDIRRQKVRNAPEKIRSTAEIIRMVIILLICLCIFGPVILIVLKYFAK